MRILVTGATGFIGRTFVKALSNRGHDVVAVSRSAAAAVLGEHVKVLEADPMVAGPWQATAAECDAAITLAGEHVGGRRWSDEQKGLIRSSRIRSTRNVVEAWAREPRARVMLGCSATHYYGPRPSREILDESAGAGDTFLARAMREWEDEANRATRSGARVVNMRIGVVLGRGSALDYCVPMVKGFLGHIAGARGSSFSWIHHEDNVGLMLHALERQDLHGPLNMTAPVSLPGRASCGRWRGTSGGRSRCPCPGGSRAWRWAKRPSSGFPASTCVPPRPWPPVTPSNTLTWKRLSPTYSAAPRERLARALWRARPRARPVERRSTDVGPSPGGATTRLWRRGAAEC